MMPNKISTIINSNNYTALEIENKMFWYHTNVLTNKYIYIVHDDELINELNNKFTHIVLLFNVIEL
jgi:predicted DNA-binding protein (MmcQ/YjbR family)